LCLVIFVIANLDSNLPDWERAGQVSPEGHHILYWSLNQQELDTPPID
jgi:hypothetical protein